MNMNIINGRNFDFDGFDNDSSRDRERRGRDDFDDRDFRNSGCGCGDFDDRDFRNSGCGCDDFGGRGRRGCRCDRGPRRRCGCGCGCGRPRRERCDCDCKEKEPVSSIKLICTDMDGNGICNCAFELKMPNGDCKTIDLRNCDNSGDIPVFKGCTIIRNTRTPRGLLPLAGQIVCEVGFDNCDRPFTTVRADSCLDDQICVRREFGTTIITCKFLREVGSGCNNGCECSGL